MGNGRKCRRGDPQLAIGYTRASTDDQVLTHGGQRHSIEAWCQAHGLRLLEVFSDSLCNATPLAERPGLQAALAAVHAQRAGIVVAAKWDRFSRVPRVREDIEARIDHYGARAQSADGVGNGDSSDDEMHRDMDCFVTRHAWRRLKENTSRALGQLKREGKRYSRFCPYGYSFTPDGRVVQDPHEQEAVKLMRAWRAEGRPATQIVEDLEARGYLSRLGARLSCSTVYHVTKDVAPLRQHRRWHRRPKEDPTPRKGE